MKALFTQFPSTQRLPIALVHGAENTAPAAATVLADSGPLAAGLYIAVSDVAVTDTAANLIQLAHRNAANSADLELSDTQSGVVAGGPGGDAAVAAMFQVGAGERIVVRNKNAGTAALFYQADLYVFPAP